MKFTYEKVTDGVVLTDKSPATAHILKLEGGEFRIEASSLGFRISGESQWFQPEAGECHLPVEDFREFFNRLASAAELSWKEIQRENRETASRQAIIGVT